jgi:hypothetical protein
MRGASRVAWEGENACKHCQNLYMKDRLGHLGIDDR